MRGNWIDWEAPLELFVDRIDTRDLDLRHVEMGHGDREVSSCRIRDCWHQNPPHTGPRLGSELPIRLRQCVTAPTVHATSNRQGCRNEPK